MSAVPAPSGNKVVLLRGRHADHLEWLCEHLAANRLMPVPPAERQFVGDGDFRAIGAEFLRHFVRLGGLEPGHKVLEIGCGIGRMALPLTQYLGEGASYDGLDVVEDGIRWCAQEITPAYPAFRFHHLDAVNGLYNPGGRIDTAAAVLPFPDAGFDFAILTSVLTHLREAETARYAAELGRLLRPGGRCFISLFLVDAEVRGHLRAGTSRLPFPADAPGPEFLADASVPNGAVAYDEAFLLGLFARHGLVPQRPVLHGHWCGRQGPANFQDLLVLAKEGGR